MNRTLARLLAAAVVLTLAFGCAPAREEEGRGLQLWFPADPAQNRLSAALGACPYQGDDRSIPGLMAALLAGPAGDKAELSPITPGDTRLLSWSLADRVASVELSAAYGELVGIDLTLADCCVTLTLTQLEGVDGVRVTVSGGERLYRDRRPLYPEDMLFSGAEEAPVELQ